jgi:hypothetical protein
MHGAETKLKNIKTEKSRPYCIKTGAENQYRFIGKHKKMELK